MFNKIKIQTGFMLVFSTAIVLIILMLYWFINSYVLSAYEKVMVANSKQLNMKISQQVDLYFNDLNQLSKNSVTNRNLIDDMRELDSLTHVLTQYETLSFHRSFESYSSYLINYSDLNSSKVYIYGRQNRFKFAYGSLPLESNFDKIYDQQPYKNQLENQVVIYFDNANTTSEGASPSISIVRAFADISGNMLGYIEIQQDYSKLKQISNLGESGEVFILDRNDRIVYPAEKLDSATLDLLHDVISSGGVKPNLNHYLYTSYTSEETGLTTLVKHANESVFKPLYTLQNTTLISIVAIVLLSLSMIYLITLRMTEPIRKLRSSILKVDFDNFALFTNQKSPSNEVNLLNDAFHQMMERLKHSMNQEMLANKEELKARFSALQAQIAPHFIHNILYLMSIAAEENRNDDVMSMCKRLSNMLRYMAESPFQKVTVAEEMTYAIDYLSLIQHKYEDFIELNIDVDEAAQTVLLPRLTIQPFIENAIQHAFNECDPPWKITISCQVKGLEWEILIQDNGSGMTPERKKILDEQIELILSSDSFASQETSGIGGMGILNTLMRLKLLYPNTLCFSIENDSSNGLIVRIQASIHIHP